MEQQFQIFFDKIKIEMAKQSVTITDNLVEKIDEKFQFLFEENRKLKEKVEVLEKKSTIMRKRKSETTYSSSG